MSHTKAGGSTALGRDSISKRLGVKKFAGQHVNAGGILARQRGSRFRAGLNVMKGVDDTLFARVAGMVKFIEKKRKKFTGKLETVRYITVVSDKA